MGPFPLEIDPLDAGMILDCNGQPFIQCFHATRAEWLMRCFGSAKTTQPQERIERDGRDGQA